MFLSRNLDGSFTVLPECVADGGARLVKPLRSDLPQCAVCGVTTLQKPTGPVQTYGSLLLSDEYAGRESTTVSWGSLEFILARWW